MALETDTTDENLQGGLTLGSAPPEEEEDAGALPYAAVRTAMTARKEAAKARQKYYDDLTAKLAARQAGPSFSERMYELSSAFFAPTSTRGFSGVAGNVLPVLASQQKAQREGEIKREDALSALAAAQLAQSEGLAEQVVDTEIELAKLTRPKPSRVVGNTVIGGVPSVIMQDADGNVTTKPLVDEPTKGASLTGKTETRGDVVGYYDESGVWKPLPSRPKPKPTQISATSDGQPVFMTDAGPVDAFGNPVTSFDAKPLTLSGSEQKLLIASEDVLASAEDTLGKLRRVMELNPKALEGSLTGFRKQVGSLFASDDPTYVATEELDNTLSSMALSMLKSTFPGSVTEGERKALMALQGSSSLPRAARERIYRNAFEAAQTVAARARDRIQKTQTGYYSKRTTPTTPAAGKPRVINWNK
jgi:hypothetical protein